METFFKGVGTLPAKLHLKENVTPCVNPTRRVPEAPKTKLKAELNQMVEDKIIAEVSSEPTNWVNSIFVVEKPNTAKLRICLDPKQLNDAIKRSHYAIPALEDITVKLAGASHLSKLDITHAYWSVKLDE